MSARSRRGDQHWNIVFSFVQRRNFNGKHIETIEQIAPESSGSDGRRQVMISSGNHSDVRPYRFCSADTFEFALLKHTQQRMLGIGGKIADFIEEDRAAFGDFEASQSPLKRAGESAFLVAEQFRSDQ